MMIFFFEDNTILKMYTAQVFIRKNLFAFGSFFADKTEYSDKNVYSKAGVPKLGYMYPQGCILTFQGVH